MSLVEMRAMCATTAEGDHRLGGERRTTQHAFGGPEFIVSFFWLALLSGFTALAVSALVLPRAELKPAQTRATPLREPAWLRGARSTLRKGRLVPKLLAVALRRSSARVRTKYEVLR